MTNTHRGLFRYQRLPYGVSSAPALFQATMETLLRNIPGTGVFLDDIIVTGNPDEEHIENLDRVLTKLEESGLRLKRPKCTLLSEEVIYLGHRINKEGLHPMMDKVEALQKTRAPTCVTELKSYLGLLNYYHKFLPDLSTVLAPLHYLLRKDVKWQWEPELEDSFEQSKRMILSAKVLVHYDPKKKLLLQCDASPYGVASVLSHIMEDGTERPVGFASRSLNSAERNYSQLDKEGLAVMFGLRKFHKYLYGRPFEIVTDHFPLVSLFNELKLNK